MIISRTARLLECLEFHPDEFYQLLEETEGAVRNQLGSGTARIPDLPQYIVTKLGLNKNLIEHDGDISPPTMHEAGEIRTSDKEIIERKQHDSIDEQHSAFIREAPKEEDFETVRVYFYSFHLK